MNIVIALIRDALALSVCRCRSFLRLFLLPSGGAPLALPAFFRPSPLGFDDMVVFGCSQNLQNDDYQKYLALNTYPVCKLRSCEDF